MQINKTFSLAITTALISAPVNAADLTIDITDIEEISGAIMLAMYDSAAGFDDGESAPVHATAVSVESDTVTLTVPDLAAGDYAIRLYHDANGNGELDTNMMGLPIEGYGFSGNGGRFGPPSFAEAKFSITDDGDHAVSIQLR